MRAWAVQLRLSDVLRSRTVSGTSERATTNSPHVNSEVGGGHELGFPGRGGTEDVEQCQNVVEAISCGASG